jgi:hypothetical protein
MDPQNIVVEGKKRKENHGQRERMHMNGSGDHSEEVEHVRLSSLEENWEKKLLWVQELLGSVF